MPEDQQGVSEVFEFYLDNLKTIVTRKRKLRTQDKIVEKAVNKLAEALYPNHLSGVPWQEARKIIDPLDPKNISEKSLLEDLISEGLLAEDINYIYKDDKKQGTPVVRFTYERFSDHFIASRILSTYQDIEEFKSDLDNNDDLISLFFSLKMYDNAGLLTAISIQLRKSSTMNCLTLFQMKRLNIITLNSYMCQL